MAVSREKKLEVVRRRERTAELYIQGRTQCEIAETLGVSQPTVCQDLQAIQKAWRELLVADTESTPAQAGA